MRNPRYEPKDAKWAASLDQYLSAMSYYLHAKTVVDPLISGEPAVPLSGEPSPGEAPDHEIDTALRNVALPDGLMMRLGSLAYSVPEDTADHVDWLGC